MLIVINIIQVYKYEINLINYILIQFIINDIIFIGNGIRCIKNKSIKANDVNFKKYSNSNLKMVDDAVPVPADGKFDPAAWLNPNTRGGVIVWSFLLILIPIGI